MLFFTAKNQAMASTKVQTKETQTKEEDSLKGGGPTRIRSDIIDIKRKSQTIDFLRNVVVEKEDSSLVADKMTVFYQEKSSSPDNHEKKSSITRIDAKGNVKIFSKEFVASGEYGQYDPKQDIFILEKNVIVNNGTSIASGQKFIYDLTTKVGHFVGTKDEANIGGAQGKSGADKRVVVIIGDDMINSKKEKNNKKNER